VTASAKSVSFVPALSAEEEVSQLQCPFCRLPLTTATSLSGDNVLVAACTTCDANVIVHDGHSPSQKSRRSRVATDHTQGDSTQMRTRRAGVVVSITLSILSYCLLIIFGAWGFEELKQQYDPYDVDEHLYSRLILEAQGWTALHLAAARGNEEQARRLLGDPSQLEAKNQRERTPLYEAAKRGRLGTMKLLLDEGANLEAKAMHGFTPLFPAIQRGHLEAVQLLVSRGAQINARCDCGATALFEAVKWGREDVAEYLLQHGANVNAKVNGQTALAFAEEGKMEDMADILRGFGGKTFKESEQLVQRGVKLFEGEQWDEAITVFTKAIELDPENVPGYSHRAATWIRKGNLGMAFDDYHRILQLSPTHFESHMNLSWIYAQQQQWDLGIELWSNLIKLEPNNAQAYYERAHHAWYKKDHRLIREDLHRSCSLGYARGCDMWKGGGGPPTS
jgi:tetratricopeptide (TPR) repeat protein